MRQPMDVLHATHHDVFSVNEEGVMVVSSDGVDFSSSLSIDKKRADSYLILALVDQLSSYIEPNDPTQPAKYMLGHLVRRKLIPEHTVLDFEKDLSGLRKAFKVLISQLTLEMSDHFSRSDSNALTRYYNNQKQSTFEKHSIPKKVLLDVTPNIPRFRLDFRVIENLGKGGFGQVYKAQHNVDGKIYAIKRVNMKDKKPACNAVREVKILANLIHPNIVRYHNCWLEADFSRKRRQRIREIKNNSRSSVSSSTDMSLTQDSFRNHNPCDDDEFEIVFENSSIGGRGVEDNRLAAIPYNDKTSSEHVYSSSLPESNSLSSHFSDKPLAPLEPAYNRQRQCGLILNIQMQCCETDLAQRLSKRTQINPAENIKYMRDLLSGLEYLHANNIIHRDIKPSNLFIDKSTLQIGDVGLARYNLFQSDLNQNHRRTNGLTEEEQWAPILYSDNLTRSVGTFLYAAPEMQSSHSSSYHCSSDIYSCGIVLFELFSKFGTTMERVETLKALRAGELASSFVLEHPEVADLVRKMTHPDQNKRPSAAELIRDEFFCKNEAPTLEQAESIILQLTAQLDKCKKRLETERALSRVLRKQFRDFKSSCKCNLAGNIEEVSDNIEQHVNMERLRGKSKDDVL